MEKVLIELKNKNQVHDVFTKLHSLGEKIDPNYFSFISDGDWRYIGYYKTKKWTIARPHPNFTYSNEISYEEFCMRFGEITNKSTEPNYEIY